MNIQPRATTPCSVTDQTPILTFATKKLSTGANGQREDATSSSFFCPRSFDRAVMVDQSRWYDLRLETRETRVRTLPWASSGHVTTRSMSPQHLRSPMLTFATKKLSTGANGQKEDAASFFCPRSFDRAVMLVIKGGVAPQVSITTTVREQHPRPHHKCAITSSELSSPVEAT